MGNTMKARRADFNAGRRVQDLLEISRIHYKSLDCNKEMHMAWAGGALEISTIERLKNESKLEYDEEDGHVISPQVFIDGQPMGGADKVQNLLDSGMLTRIALRRVCPVCLQQRSPKSMKCGCGAVFSEFMPGARTVEEHLASDIWDYDEVSDEEEEDFSSKAAHRHLLRGSSFVTSFMMQKTHSFDKTEKDDGLGCLEEFLGEDEGEEVTKPVSMLLASDPLSLGRDRGDTESEDEDAVGSLPKFQTFSAAPAPKPLATLSGHLWKKSAGMLRLSPWDRRYVVVKEMRIYWFKTEADCPSVAKMPRDGGPSCKGLIDVSTDPVHLDSNEEPTLFTICPAAGKWNQETVDSRMASKGRIGTLGDSVKDYTFDCTDSEFSRWHWVALISQHIKNADRVRSGNVSGLVRSFAAGRVSTCTF